MYTQPVQLQPCRHRHLRATLCCLLQCACCWLEDLYMLTYTPCLLRCLQKAKFTQIFTTEKLGLNHFESLRPYQVCPLGPLEGPVLQLKTGLRATSILTTCLLQLSCVRPLQGIHLTSSLLILHTHFSHFHNCMEIWQKQQNLQALDW